MPDDEPDPRVGIVWTLAQNQLTSQMAAVDELRSRVGTLIAAAATATGFLAGQALDTRHGVPVGAWVGIGAAAVLVVACAYILWPREWAAQSVDTTKLLAKVDAKPDQRIDGFQRYMASYARTHFETNRRQLEQMYRVFAGALLLLGVDFAGWIWALVQQ